MCCAICQWLKWHNLSLPYCKLHHSSVYKLCSTICKLLRVAYRHTRLENEADVKFFYLSKWFQNRCVTCQFTNSAAQFANCVDWKIRHMCKMPGDWPTLCHTFYMMTLPRSPHFTSALIATCKYVNLLHAICESVQFAKCAARFG